MWVRDAAPLSWPCRRRWPASARVLVSESPDQTFRIVVAEAANIHSAGSRPTKTAFAATERLLERSPHLETIPRPSQSLPSPSMNWLRLPAKTRRTMRCQGTLQPRDLEQASPSTGKSRRLSLAGGFAPT